MSHPVVFLGPLPKHQVNVTPKKEKPKKKECSLKRGLLLGWLRGGPPLYHYCMEVDGVELLDGGNMERTYSIWRMRLTPGVCKGAFAVKAWRHPERLHRGLDWFQANAQINAYQARPDAVLVYGRNLNEWMVTDIVSKVTLVEGQWVKQPKSR